MYVAFEAETADQEFNQFFYRLRRSTQGRTLARNGNLRPDPYAMLGIHLRVQRLLDLTRKYSHGRQIRRLFAVSNRSDAELLQPWAGIANAPTQVLGTEIFNDGFLKGSYILLRSI